MTGGWKANGIFCSQLVLRTELRRCSGVPDVLRPLASRSLPHDVAWDLDQASRLTTILTLRLTVLFSFGPIQGRLVGNDSAVSCETLGLLEPVKHAPRSTGTSIGSEHLAARRKLITLLWFCPKTIQTVIEVVCFESWTPSLTLGNRQLFRVPTRVAYFPWHARTCFPSHFRIKNFVNSHIFNSYDS